MGVCRIIPLGGLGEVGKNMTVYEANGEIVVVDAGLAFPRDEHLGVDLVLPDMSYLRDRAKDVKAVILTHGHEDHVGALPYLLREVPVREIWATRLTTGLIKSRLDEHGARELEAETQPALDILKVQGNPIAIKAALNLLGHEVGGLRLPLVEADAAELAQIRGCLERLKLLEPARA